MSIRAILAAFLLLASLILLPIANAHQRRGHASQQACAGVDVMPTHATPAAAAATVLCLVNEQRRHAGLAPLRANSRLGAAARGHTRDMLVHHYYEHTSPTGSTMERRIFASGYVSPHGAWSMGENLVWATGSLATPRRLVSAWMHSPGHRSNILGHFRDTGIGLALGAPDVSAANAPAVTVTEDFGRRG